MVMGVSHFNVALCVCACVCVCVSLRERGERGGERERERERESLCIFVMLNGKSPPTYPFPHSSVHNVVFVEHVLRF